MEQRRSWVAEGSFDAEGPDGSRYTVFVEREKLEVYEQLTGRWETAIGGRQRFKLADGREVFGHPDGGSDLVVARTETRLRRLK